jgi:hypothetical protein
MTRTPKYNPADYLPKPKTDQPGHWVPIDPSYASAMGRVLNQKLSFHTSTGARDGENVKTYFPAGWSGGMEHFMKMEGFRGVIRPSDRSGVAEVSWTHRYVVDGARC